MARRMEEIKEERLVKVNLPKKLNEMRIEGTNIILTSGTIVDVKGMTEGMYKCFLSHGYLEELSIKDVTRRGDK